MYKLQFETPSEIYSTEIKQKKVILLDEKKTEEVYKLVREWYIKLNHTGWNNLKNLYSRPTI